MNLFEIKIILFGFLISNSLSQDNRYKLCVTEKYVSECEQLQRGNSEVFCEKVQDSIECAIKIRNGEADFGVFTAESTLHLSTLGWQDMTVIKQLRHRERRNSETDFESVVLVKSDYDGNTLDALKSKKFCHPGLYYDKSQRWTERFLKHFERSVTTPKCESYKSPAEIETITLNEFFGPSCRPGKWSHDIKEDTRLKSQYKSLCQLCGGNTCEYPDGSLSGPHNNHQKALLCLKNNGDVTYVSKEDAIHFLEREGENARNYKYLCSNGTVQAAINNSLPCVWLRQPWKVIISRNEKSVVLEKHIDNWISKSKNGGWEGALSRIINADSYLTAPVTMEKPNEYIRKYRSIPLLEQYCDAEIKWCTINYEEQEKCTIIRNGGISTGVYPLITCNNPVSDSVSCLDDVSKNKSDFVGTDSNFGYLARTMYNLTAAMYYETEMHQYSSVVVVVHDQSKYQKFENLKNAQACLPEFGATPSITFINLGKERKFFNRRECRYHKLLHNFFDDSCAPGAQDYKHIFRNVETIDPLCKLCLNENVRNSGNFNLQVNITTGQDQPVISEGQVTCAADERNRYYGNLGALKCLNEVGDVAILELQSLKEHAQSLLLNENKFRIICRNGSLANRPGFDVDLKCALTTIVDGEILIRRGTNKTTAIINILSVLDSYFQIDPDFKMYNIFKGQKNLLFKDSTIGLTSARDDENVGPAVHNYIKLFKNIEDCQQGAAATKSTLSIFALTAIIVSLRLF